MPFKSKSQMKEYQAQWYQNHKADADWKAHQLENARQWKANNKARMAETNKRLREKKKMENLLKNKEAWYAEIKADIVAGNKPFTSGKLTEAETNLWWEICNHKIAKLYIDQACKYGEEAMYDGDVFPSEGGWCRKCGCGRIIQYEGPHSRATAVDAYKLKAKCKKCMYEENETLSVS